ncbi:MAG TPA: galactokinase [Bacteroidota bacterium]|nr:galactokinase [Bacteroidota bacterium]
MRGPEPTVAAFTRRFAGTPLVVRSPGRINLIGEHTDYNEGFVLPAAVDKAVYFAAAPRDDRQYHFVAVDLHQDEQGSFDTLAHSSLGWPDYLLGVIEQLERRGLKPRGVNLAFGGSIPIGAGMSSSAALEAGFLTVLNTLNELGLDKLTMAQLCQQAENSFVGVRCGIMDQVANLFGREHTLLKLDCRSLDIAEIPFVREDLRILLCDSMVRHELASSEYNARRHQCEQGVATLRRQFADVRALRDATTEMLASMQSEFDPVVYQRCTYVVEENTRVTAASEALLKGDIDAFGDLLVKSHEGLRDLYQVSCKELDILVDVALGVEGVFGARLMGGGFGGCTINLVREDCVEEFAMELPEAYRDATGREMNLHVCSIANGTSVLHSA